jgi:hypothetical protein
MVVNIKAIGSMIKCMVKVNLIGHKEKNMKEIIFKTKNKGRGNSFMEMAHITMDNGTKEGNMGGVNSKTSLGNITKGDISTVNQSNDLVKAT